MAFNKTFSVDHTGSGRMIPPACLFAYDPPQVKSQNTWIIDTGASDHMTFYSTLFTSLSSKSRHLYITSANGVPSPVIGEGSVPFSSALSLS